MSNLRFQARMLLIILAAASCSGSDATQPVAQPGTLMFSLTTPASDDGIMLFTVKGPGLSAVTPARTSYRIFSRQVDSNELRVIVQGQLATGPLFSVQVPDTNAKAAYSVTIDEIASTTDALRASTAGYAISVAQ